MPDKKETILSTLLAVVLTKQKIIPQSFAIDFGRVYKL